MKLLGILHDTVNVLLIRPDFTGPFDGITGEYDQNQTTYFAMRDMCKQQCGYRTDNWIYVGLLLPDTHVYSCVTEYRLTHAISSEILQNEDIKIVRMRDMSGMYIKDHLDYILPFAKNGRMVKEIFACLQD